MNNQRPTEGDAWSCQGGDVAQIRQGCRDPLVVGCENRLDVVLALQLNGYISAREPLHTQRYDARGCLEGSLHAGKDA